MPEATPDSRSTPACCGIFFGLRSCFKTKKTVALGGFFILLLVPESTARQHRQRRRYPGLPWIGVQLKRVAGKGGAYLCRLKPRVSSLIGLPDLDPGHAVKQVFKTDQAMCACFRCPGAPLTKKKPHTEPSIKQPSAFAAATPGPPKVKPAGLAVRHQPRLPP